MRSWRVKNPRGGLRGLPIEIWVLSAVTLVNRAGTMVLPFLTLYITPAVYLFMEWLGGKLGAGRREHIPAVEAEVVPARPQAAAE